MTNDELMNGTLSAEDRDTIIEMTSISMGAAASTLSILLGQEVDIAIPDLVEYASLEAMPEPFAGDLKSMVAVHYATGKFASNVFVLKNSDARRLAELMLGNPGEPSGDPLSDLEVGAVGELMNQMMNSAASGMATVLQESVEINNPEVLPYGDESLLTHLPELLAEPFAALNLQLKIAGQAPIEMLQLMIASQAKGQMGHLLAVKPEESASSDLPPMAAAAPAAASAPVEPGPSARFTDFGQPYQPQPQPATAGASRPQAAPPQQPRVAAAAPSGGRMDVDPVTVRPVEFASFDHQPNIYGEENKNLELVMDVTLNLTVELGKTEISIKDVLELTRGSVIELDRVAGEPVDLYANGKLIAKGEVVVIEDNFGLRITSIVSPADRLRGI